MSYENENTQRIVLVQNPRCTQVDGIETVVNLLDGSHWQGAVESFVTGDPAKVDNIDLLAEGLRDGDTLLSCGGDGQRLIAGNALVRSGVNGHLIAMPLGNANDGSLSTYGRDIIKRGRFLDLLDHGQSQIIGGIRVERGDEDPTYALGYVSLGLSAHAAERVGSTKFREKKRQSRTPDFILEGREIIEAIKDYEDPLAYIEDGVNHQKVAELLFADQRRMAKVIRFRVPKFGKELVNVELPHADLVAHIAGKFLIGGPVGVIVGEPVKRRELVITRPTKMQLDGEVEDVAADTFIAVEHQPSVIKVLVAA